MQVEIKEEMKSIKYPRLMSFRGKGDLIVLFSYPGQGTIINSAESKNKIGEFASNWIMSNFVDFEGSITLRND